MGSSFTGGLLAVATAATPHTELYAIPGNYAIQRKP
jgi:hypothetical protein